LLGASGKQLGEPHERRGGAAGLVAEARRHEAGAEAARDHAEIGQPGGELAGEQDVAQLRGAVDGERPVGFFRLQVVEIEPSLAVRIRGGVDHARRRAGDEAPDQPGGQHEIGHVIEREGALEPVLGDGAAGEHGAGIVDQHVDARLRGGDLAADALDLLEAQQIRIVDRVAAVGRAGLDLRQRGGAARAVARHDDEARAHAGEALRGDLTDTGGGAGHDNDFAIHHGLPPPHQQHRPLAPSITVRQHDRRMTACRRGGWIIHH
jgi:hypothetical protein